MANILRSKHRWVSEYPASIALTRRMMPQQRASASPRPSVAGDPERLACDLERLACEYPDLASRFLARAQRLRWRMWQARA
jgi:hypothetical protein